MTSKYQAIIDHNGDHKYIVVCKTNTNNNVKEHLIVSYPLKYHSMITRTFEETLRTEETIQVFGGGILTINRNKKTIRTYGSSGTYGKPDPELVKEILGRSPGYDDFALDITVTNYIRD